MAPLDYPAAQGYTFLEKLNSGSFGDVYLAQSNAGGEYVAIKVLYGDDRESIDAELRFCKLFSHPHIVKTYDVLEFSDGQRWVVSELCENGDLFGAILPMEGVGDERRIKKYFGQLVDAVAYLHSYGIVHRDIKPENILLSSSDDVKLCDFGLSKFETEPWDEGVGTVAYMAPEVYQLPQHTAMCDGKATDMWSLGCTLYTMLAGMLPWEAPCFQDADYESFRENMGRFDRPDWSEDLHELLSGMLHWDPSRRLTITQVQARMRTAHARPWILPKSRARSTLNLAGVFSRGMSYGRLDDEVRRPRSPPGAIHPHDYVIFRDGDGDVSDAGGGAGSDWHVGSPMGKSGSFFPDPRRVIPPPRRTRYDSSSCEIEFNPYLVSDSPLLLRSRLPSVRSSSSATATDSDDEDDDGSWFAAGAMSFNTLPRFDSVGNSQDSSCGDADSSVASRATSVSLSSANTASATASVSEGARSSSVSPRPGSGAAAGGFGTRAGISTDAKGSGNTGSSPPRFLLGADDEEDGDDVDVYASKGVEEEKANRRRAVEKLGTSAAAESDAEGDQGIGGSLPDESEIYYRRHRSGSQQYQNQNQTGQDQNQNLDQKSHHHQHRVRWGDLSDRDMSFSVLPQFGSLALDDDDDTGSRDCDCCGSGSEDSGVEGVKVPRSKPIAVPGASRARLNSAGSAPGSGTART